MLTMLLAIASPRANVAPPSKPTDSAVAALVSSALTAASLIADTSIAPWLDAACEAVIVACTEDGFSSLSTGAPISASIALNSRFASFQPIELKASVSATALPAEAAELALVESIWETSSASTTTSSIDGVDRARRRSARCADLDSTTLVAITPLTASEAPVSALKEPPPLDATLESTTARMNAWSLALTLTLPAAHGRIQQISRRRPLRHIVQHDQTRRPLSRSEPVTFRPCGTIWVPLASFQKRRSV